MVRSPCCEKLSVRKDVWSEDEDTRHGIGNWTAVSKKSGVRKCGQSCRFRWSNYQKPDLSNESFTPQEEELIIKLHGAIGSRWPIIAQQLPGKTENEVKTYWNSNLRKKLSEMGIDPVTHKPFSQILTDYGNIGGLPRCGTTQIGSLNRELKNVFDIQYDQNSPETFSNFNNQLTATILATPKLEPIEENFNNNNPSLDLLSQIQAIRMATNASNSINNIDYIQCSFSPSTSSSSTENEVSFNWSDFLLEDAFVPGNVNIQEKENCATVEEGKCNNMATSSMEASTSSDSAFVEAMLDWANDMFLEFPGLLDEPSI